MKVLFHSCPDDSRVRVLPITYKTPFKTLSFQPLNHNLTQIYKIGHGR